MLPRSAFFSLFSVPDPESRDVPIPPDWPFPFSLIPRLPILDEALLTAVEVNEGPLRFRVDVDRQGGRLVASNRVGDEAATVHIRWTPIPWSYAASPIELPPQTLLNPFSSQRFTMLDGRFRFADSEGSGFDGFGAGRTFPLFPRGLALRIGAVIDILQGRGRFAGLTGTVVVNGEIEPPNGLNLNLMVRLLDPPAELVEGPPLPPLAPRPFPDPSATFVTLLGESDPGVPSRSWPLPGGGWGYELHERLRAVDLDFAVVPERGPQSRSRLGVELGRARTVLLVRPQPTGPLAVQSAAVTLDFGDGAIGFQLVEGRGFARGDLLRFGAFGPSSGQGSGQLAGVQGNLTVNGLLTTSPLESSNLYVLRLANEADRFRASEGTWAA
jgi:hypothetical protein